MKFPQVRNFKIKITEGEKRFFVKFGVSFVIGLLFSMLLLGFLLFAYGFFSHGLR